MGAFKIFDRLGEFGLVWVRLGAFGVFSRGWKSFGDFESFGE